MLSASGALNSAVASLSSQINAQNQQLAAVSDEISQNGIAPAQNVTGSGNTAIGISAGQNVSGDANIALGLSAGQGMSGSNNIAIGTNAGLGNGNIISDGIAIGANARVSAYNAVALGAGSVADQANTISVGAPGDERRIVNVASGVAPSDAATYGQLTNAITQTQQQITQVGAVADKGIAMSMAQSGAGTATPRPGETAFAMGSGYFEGETAIGVGLARASKSGERIFHMASSMSPGLGNIIGLQASYQMRVGKASAAMLPGVVPAEVPFDEWYAHGCSEIRVIVPGRAYKAYYGSRIFRVELEQVNHPHDGDGHEWAISIDEKSKNGLWESVEDAMDLRGDRDAGQALRNAIVALGTFAH